MSIILRSNAFRLALAAAVLAGFAVTFTIHAGADDGVPLPTFEVGVAPYTTERLDPSKCYQFEWLRFHSPTVPGDADRLLHVGGSGPDVHDEWWIALDEKIGPGWDAPGGGGYYLNFHNASVDVGNTGGGGIGWGFGSGVSAVGLVYGPATALAPSRNRLHLEYAGIPGDEVALPDPGIGTWFSILVHVVFGRTDGTTARPGSIQVWYDGQDKPVVDLRDIDTLQRATNPADGQSYVQQWVDVWQGGPYGRGEPCASIGPVTRTSETVAARFGTTIRQMLDDTQVQIDADNSYGSVHESGQPNYGDSWWRPAAAARTTADFKLPGSVAAQAGNSSFDPGSPPAPPPGVTTDPLCGVCTVVDTPTGIAASIGGGLDDVDTAYKTEDAAPGGGRLFVRDELGLAQGQRLSGNLAVAGARDAGGDQVYELYAAPDRSLHLWSPPGGLRATQINLPCGVTVPNDGSRIRVEVSALANSSVTVRVDDVDRLTVSRLAGATTGTQTAAWAGIDHYDSAAAVESVTAYHDALATSRDGWLGSAPAQAPATPDTTTTLTAPAPSTTVPAGSAPAGELLRDGDFESDPASAWYTVPDGGAYSWGTGEAKDGSRSVRIDSSVSGLTRWMTQTGSIPAVAGARYEASAWFSTSAKATVALSFWSSDRRPLGTAESPPVTGSTWTEATVASAAPAGSAFVRVELRLHGPGHLAADDASLTGG
jgi:hypothetical protein